MTSKCGAAATEAIFVAGAEPTEVEMNRAADDLRREPALDHERVGFGGSRLGRR